MRSLRLVTQRNCDFSSVFAVGDSHCSAFCCYSSTRCRPLSYPFLVMRAMFDVPRFCIKCGEFLARGHYTHSSILCVQFWKLRQSEVEPYTLQCRPLRVKYGDLTDPVCAFPSSPLGLSSPVSYSFLQSHRSAIQSSRGATF